MAVITLQGNEIHTSGSLPAVGAPAPDFTLVNKDLENVSIKNLGSNYKLISIVPSLDTPVCTVSTKKFNDIAERYPDVDFIIISADLPFAMSRFCGIEETRNVTCLSMMRSRNFAKDYGVLLEDGPLEGITARAVLVLDTENNVAHTQLVEEIADEPDYDAALSALPEPAA